VAHVWRLAVERLRAGLFEQLLCPPAPLDRDHRIERAVPDRDVRERRLQVELEAGGRGHESAERNEPSRTGSSRAEAERERHHRTLREAAEDHAPGSDSRPLGQLVQPGARLRKRRRERRGLREADLMHRVPVRSSRRKMERPARRDTQKASWRVEQVEQGEEIPLVGTAPVEEHEEAVRLPRRGSTQVRERVRGHAPRNVPVRLAPIGDEVGERRRD